MKDLKSFVSKTKVRLMKPVFVVVEVKTSKANLSFSPFVEVNEGKATTMIIDIKHKRLLKTQKDSLPHRAILLDAVLPFGLVGYEFCQKCA
ncbi:hypothetical protein HYU11_03300 [Candidatus Woesearchaeota archaeon]|nr:hypothetical protein [Candidatus Woesearchaeota archaeon]